MPAKTPSLQDMYCSNSHVWWLPPCTPKAKTEGPTVPIHMQQWTGHRVATVSRGRVGKGPRAAPDYPPRWRDHAPLVINENVLLCFIDGTAQIKSVRIPPPIP